MPSDEDDLRAHINAQFAELRKQLTEMDRWTAEQDAILIKHGGAMSTSSRRIAEANRRWVEHDESIVHMEQVLDQHDLMINRVYRRMLEHAQLLDQLNVTMGTTLREFVAHRSDGHGPR